jgi:hypothetical protein
MLELEFVEFSQRLRAREIRRLTFLFELDLFAEGIFQPALDQINREIGDVDPDPSPPELLRSVNCCAATAKNDRSLLFGSRHE